MGTSNYQIFNCFVIFRLHTKNVSVKVSVASMDNIFLGIVLGFGFSVGISQGPLWLF